MSRRTKPQPLTDQEQQRLASRLIKGYLRKHGEISISRMRLYLMNNGVEDHNIVPVQFGLTAGNVIELTGKNGECLRLHQTDVG